MMADQEPIEPYYQKQANDFVDMLYDKRFPSDSLAAESIQGLKEYAGFLFQSQATSAVRCARLVDKIKMRETA